MVVLRFLFTLFIITSYSWALADVSAAFNRDSIGFNETVTLTITTDDSDVDSFDSSTIEKDFEVLSTRSSSQRSFINFTSTFQKTWQLELSPKKTGTLHIGEIALGKEKTQALTLNVSDAKNGLVNGQAQGLFLEVSTEKESYSTQEQIIVTIKLNDALMLQNLQLSPLNIDNSFVEELQQTQYSRNINGRSYKTYEVRYAIFAQSSGQLTIPSIVAQGMQITRSQHSGMFGQSYSQPVRSKSTPIQLTINPPPKNAAKPWLPAQTFSIHESFSQAPKDLKVGDSITRSITLSATGLSHEQLPSITPVEINGIKIYQEVSEQQNQKTPHAITSQKIIQQTLVFTQEGEYQLPEIVIDWYSTKEQKNKKATLKGLTLSVAPAPTLQNNNQPATTTVANNNLQSNATIASKPTLETAEKPWYNKQLWPWQLACLFLFVLCLGLIIAMRRRTKPMVKKSPETNATIKEAIQAFESACQAKDIKATQKTLKHLAKQQNPKLKIYSLADVQRAFNNEKLQQFIIDLDKASVNPSHGVNWLLAKECVELFKQDTKNSKVLPTLYPE